MGDLITHVSVSEHEMLLKILELATTYDQLDISNLAFAESVARRVQTIEWAYHEKLKDASGSSAGGRLESEEIAAFGGLPRTGEAAMVAPDLLDHVKSVVEKDAIILKNLRKAREEREEMRKKR